MCQTSSISFPSMLYVFVLVFTDSRFYACEFRRVRLDSVNSLFLQQGRETLGDSPG